MEALVAEANLAMANCWDKDDHSNISACSSVGDGNDLFRGWVRENMCYGQRYPWVGLRQQQLSVGFMNLSSSTGNICRYWYDPFYWLLLEASQWASRGKNKKIHIPFVVERANFWRTYEVLLEIPTVNLETIRTSKFPMYWIMGVGS